MFAVRACLCLLGCALPAAVAADRAFVDLAAVMELAGANNEEIELAKNRHQESLAQEKLAWHRFWPTISLGTAFRGHDGRVQDIAGLVFDANKRQYTLGTEILIDWSPGDLYFSALAARQTALTAEHLAESTRRQIVLEAIRRYYDLLAAEAVLAILEEDLRLTQEYARQLEATVAAGTAIRADLLRVQTQVSRDRLAIRKAAEDRDLAAAALAETLRVPPETELSAAKADLVPVSLLAEVDAGVSIAQATEQRPEMQAAAAAESAARLERERARLAPVIPSVRSGYSFGGLVGGIKGDPGNLGDSHDYFVGIGWKIGPGGLFDRQSQSIAETRKEAAALRTHQVKAVIGREVVEASARSRSASDRIAINEEAVQAAAEMVTLAEQRQASQIGVVLEYLLAREELTRAKQDRARAVTEYNSAQHEMRVAIGR